MPDDKKPLQEMSDEELKAMALRLASQKNNLKRIRRAVAQERNCRREIASAKARLEKLTSSERAALTQAIQAEGVESGAEVGTPGTP